jgi:hypothetical protein
MASLTTREPMLVFLEATPESLDAAVLSEMEMLFSELLRSSDFGLSKVVIQREVCIWGEKNLQLSARHKAILGRKREAFTQEGALRWIDCSRLTVSIGSSALTNLGGGDYRIGHLKLLLSRYLAGSVLIVENQESDGEFYRQVLFSMRKKALVKEIHVDIRNGGGSTIVAAFEAELNKANVSVCVIDSDKAAPSAPASAVAKTLAALNDRSVYVGEVLQTPCKEVENFISLDIIQRNALCATYSAFDDLCQLLDRQAGGANSNCLWLYFDLKRGMSPVLLDGHSLPEEALDWIGSKFLKEGEDIRTKIIPGFGDGILRQYLKCGLANRDFQQFMDSQYWLDNFSIFFERIYWYFVVDKRLFAL